MNPSPSATIIIPTHSHAATVDLAVQSVLDQTVHDLDVVVIGDGVTADTRDAVQKMLFDSRVRFVDLPKSPSRGEPARHEVLRAATSPFVCYLGDDDLMLPDHVETMIGLLENADFAHPLPLYVARDGSLVAQPTDLSRPECVQWHLRPQHNAVSLTGAAHRLDAYRRLPHGWRTAPSDRWSDHYMWEQWFTTPGMRYTTGSRLTVLKFEGSVRRGMEPIERRNELLEWKRRVNEAGFGEELSRLVIAALQASAVQGRLDIARLQDDVVALTAERALVEDLQREIQDLQREIEVRGEHLDELREQMRLLQADLTLTEADAATAAQVLEDRAAALVAERDAARDELNAIRATKTWRSHDRVTGRPAVSRWLKYLPK